MEMYWFPIKPANALMTPTSDNALATVKIIINNTN